MRYFVIVGHKATTKPNFSLEDIPGTSGRLDILCRSVTAAFVISHGIRKDVCVYLVLLGGDVPKTIRLRGETLRHLNPDERTTAALLKKALAVPATPEWAMSTSGIFVRTGGLAQVLDDLKAVRLIYLREDGTDICGPGAGASCRRRGLHSGRPHRYDSGRGDDDHRGRGRGRLAGTDQPARRSLHSADELVLGYKRNLKNSFYSFKFRVLSIEVITYGA